MPTNHTLRDTLEAATPGERLATLRALARTLAGIVQTTAFPRASELAGELWTLAATCEADEPTIDDDTLAGLIELATQAPSPSAERH